MTDNNTTRGQRYYWKHADEERQRNRGNAEYFRQRRAKRRAQRLCNICGKPSEEGKSVCRSCLAAAVQKRNQRKRQAIEYLGGKCIDCGLQTDFISVYDFHHKDRDMKKDGIAELLNKQRKWEVIQAELDKCVLLCANCHRIRHEREENSSLYLASSLVEPTEH